MQVVPEYCRCYQLDNDPCADKPKFIRRDLCPNVESFFLEAVVNASQTYDTDYDVATAIKQCLDTKFGPQWHVVVGDRFGRPDVTVSGSSTTTAHTRKHTMQVAKPTCVCLPPKVDPSSEKPHFVRKDLNEKLDSFFLEVVYRASAIYDTEVELCSAIKQCLDKKFGPQWHVVVGEAFGSHFEHEPLGFACVEYKGKSFLMFRFG
ncbi:unnamed protein product [Dibothriocephalus latus]|uniref:Dynein light chain n=1 Tax=Dibothriocephalus latus TaxID=60516 RepID=A0A3P6T5D3_DIBLA|nr:unnamed protein product [Dibothriocephalus latus]